MTAKRLGLFCMLAAALLSGCQELDLLPFYDREAAQEKERAKNVRSAIRGENGQSKMIGDYVKIGDNGYITVQGVGLVDRLDGTGEDPPASELRTMLLEDLRRHEVKDPQTYLSSANTALVVVKAYIPPICRKGEKIDIEVMLPDGAESTSLAGGWLMPCYLREMGKFDGQIHEGKEVVVASGPILVDAIGETSKAASAALRRGRIPGGATYLGEDRLLRIQIRNEYSTVRMSTQIAGSIGKRFHDHDEHGIQRPLAKAKDNSHLELTIHERYRDNYPRYLQCIRSLALSESAVERHIRLQQLQDEVQFGPTAEVAALQLEAIGPDAIPALKVGLASPDLEARFHCGVALAYLGNADGVAALKEAADKEPAFRIFALAALSTLPDGSAAESLRELMSHDSVETRYGAFRSFSTMAPNDPAIKGSHLAGNFSLHPVDSTGSPLIHLTRYKKAEIVVFGADQELLLPLMLRAGSRILIQGSSRGHRVLVKRIAPGESVREREVSARITDVIKAASDLGATYPDVVEMLVEAEHQHNLPGQIAIDELPVPGRVYERPLARGPVPSSSKGTPSSEVTVGSQGLLPNLFDEKPPEAAGAPAAPRIPDQPKKPLMKE